MGDFPEIDALSASILSKQPCPQLTEATQAHLKIYHWNYMLTMVNALMDKFPVLCRILSAGNFKFFAREFVQQQPSRSSNLDDYGQTFGKFLSTRPELAALSHLDDFAAMEWFYASACEPGETIDLPQGIFEIWNAIAKEEPSEHLVVGEHREIVVFQWVDDQPCFIAT